MFQTNEKRDGEIVDLKLSIGQCKLLERLVDAELYSSEVGTSTFNENALKTLCSVFMAKTRETEAEKKARFEKWVGSLQLIGGQHG